MKLVIYNKTSADVPNFRKAILWDSLFMFSMILVVLVQAVMFINADKSNIKLTLIENIVGIATIIFALIFVLLKISQISHHIIKIRQIRKQGSIQSRELDIDYTKRSSFWFYCRLFSYIMLVAITIFLVSFLTTSIFEYIYYKEINYYIPIIAMFFVGTNNACKQIENHIANH